VTGNEVARVRIQRRRDQLGNELPVTKACDRLAREELLRPQGGDADLAQTFGGWV
jgi:hypothetical protein